MGNLFKTPIDVRFRDLDAMGHVNNAVYFTYFEEGRKKFFVSSSKVENPLDFSFILAHIDCDYIRPVTLNTRLLLLMWVKEIGNKSFALGYKLVDLSDEAVVYAKGASVQVCFDYKAGRSMEIPENLKEKLMEYRREE